MLLIKLTVLVLRAALLAHKLIRRRRHRKEHGR
jgi:hypothetical protein